MSDFIRLDNDVFLNLDRVAGIIKNKEEGCMKLPYIAIIDGDADFWITQSDHDAIRDYLFKFKPDWMPKAEGKHTRGPWRMCGELRGSGCLCGQIWEGRKIVSRFNSGRILGGMDDER